MVQSSIGNMTLTLPCFYTCIACCFGGFRLGFCTALWDISWCTKGYINTFDLIWFLLLFQNVTSSPQYSTFLEHIIPHFLTFLQDREVQFLQEKPTQVGGNVIISIVYLNRHRCNLNMHTLNTQESEPSCITLKQQLRMLVLEIIHRIPTDEHLSNYLSLTWTQSFLCIAHCLFSDCGRRERFDMLAYHHWTAQAVPSTDLSTGEN